MGDGDSRSGSGIRSRAARLATASKGLPGGGDATGAVIGILIVVILVILILRLTNKEVVVS